MDWVAQNGNLDYYIEDMDDEETENLPDEKYFDYEQHGRGHFRVKHLKAALEIGGFDGNDYTLLNPLATTPEGEWEAWIWAKEGYTPIRYPSFWTMMHSIYSRFFVL